MLQVMQHGGFLLCFLWCFAGRQPCGYLSAPPAPGGVLPALHAAAGNPERDQIVKTPA